MTAPKPDSWVDAGAAGVKRVVEENARLSSENERLREALSKQQRKYLTVKGDLAVTQRENAALRAGRAGESVAMEVGHEVHAKLVAAEHENARLKAAARKLCERLRKDSERNRVLGFRKGWEWKNELAALERELEGRE